MICPYLTRSLLCPFRAYKPFPIYRLVNSPLTVTDTKIKISNDNIIENLQIPAFHGDVNPQIMENINTNVKNDIMEFKTQLETAAEESAESFKKQGKQFKPYQISNSYSITYNKNNILSVSLLYQEYISGKNSYTRTTYNYNLKTGESMPLRSLFKQGSDYIDTLNSKIRRKFTAQFKGIAEDQPYYLDDNNLVIFLRFNEIAPAISDIPIIKIPFSELSNILKSQFLKDS